MDWIKLDQIMIEFQIFLMQCNGERIVIIVSDMFTPLIDH